MSLSRIFVFALSILSASRISSQVTIADALPGCLAVENIMGVECNMSATFQFEVVGNQFVANNSDGSNCLCPGDFGNNIASFEFEVVNISSFMNVSISLDYSAAIEAYEDLSATALTGCGTVAQSSSHDQMVFYYSLNGGPFILGDYIHGTTAAAFTGTWTESGLNGNTLKIKVIASNKSNDEIFYFENLIIEGEPKPINAGPDDTSCDTDPVNLTGTGVGTWSGGLGTFGNPILPNTTYTPTTGEVGSTVTLTYAGNPGTAACAANYPAPFDDMDLTINSGPNATITGGGELCQGECTIVGINVIGGSEPFSLSFNVNGFPFNNVPGFSVNDEINICLLVGGFIPTFDPNTNTLELPGNLAGTTLSFVFTNISDNSGCPGVVDNTPVTIDLLSKPQANPFTLEKCDEGGGQATFDLNDAVFDILGNETGTVHFYSDAGLLNEEFSPYVTSSTILYAVIEGDNGCISDPVNLNLEVLNAGNVTPVSITCNGSPNCSICDDDGIIGEEISIQINLPTAQGYFVEVNYLMNSVNNSLVSNVFGTVDNILIPIDNDAIITLISVTAAGECPDVSGLGSNIMIEYNLAPVISNVTSINSCDPVTLPAITVSNAGANTGYFTGPGGTGIEYNPGDIISSTIQLYAFSGNSTCYDEELFLVEIGGSTTFDNLSNVSICGGYILPAITGTNVNSTASYFTQMNGAGIDFQVGDTLDFSTTLFVYDPNNVGCQTNQPSFQLTITPSPQINLDSIVQKCDQYKLPKITGTNLSGNEAYYSNPNQIGLQDSIGTLVTKNDTFYLYAGNALCNDKDTLIIQIQSTISYNDPLDVNACNTYELPIIAGTNVGVNAGYFTDTIGTTVQYYAGDIITAPLKLFIYDTTSFCQSNIPEFNINVSPGPEIFSINDTSACGFYVLPVIIGTSLSGNQAYYDNAGGIGTKYLAGDTIKSTQQIFAYEFNAACQAEQPFLVNIDNEPKSGNALNVQICIERDLNFDLFNLLSGNYDTNGTWTLENSNLITITDPTNTFIPQTIPIDSYRFKYSVDGGTCGIAVTFSNAIIIQTPNAGLDSVYQVCQGSSDLVNLFSLLRNETSLGGTWISSQSNPDPSNLDISGYTVGNYPFRYALSNRHIPTNSSCNDTSIITIRVVEGLNAGDVVNYGQICEGSEVNLVSLLQNNGSVGAFKNKITNATISNPSVFTLPNGANNNFVVQHIIPATGGCEADTTELRFIVNKKPNAGNDKSNDYCGTQTIELLSIITNADPNGIFINNGNFLLISNNEINPTSSGSYSFYYVVGNGNVCPKDTSEIEIIYVPAPKFELQVGQEFCIGSDLDLLFDIDFVTQGNVDITIHFVSDAQFQQGIMTGIEKIIRTTGTNNTTYIYNPTQLNLPAGKYHIVVEELLESPCSFEFYGGSFEIINGGNKTISDQYCSDDSVILYGNTYNKDNKTDTLIVSSPTGCDTTVIIDLQFLQSITSDETLDICEGKSISFNDTNFDSNSSGGQVILQNQSSTGCDSIINVSVNKLLNSTSNYTYSTCNDSYVIQFGSSIFDKANPSGTALLGIQNADGCDSFVNVSLSFIIPTSDIQIADALCEDADGVITIIESELNGDIDLLIDGVQTETIQSFPHDFTLAPGEYSITLIDEESCETTEDITIAVSDSPQVSVNEVTQSDGSKRLIIESDIPLTSILWTPTENVDCDNCEDVLVIQYGAISVAYQYGIGCNGTLNYNVFENVVEEIYFPNVMNLNSINSSFYPQKSDGYLVSALSMSIFDRWGNKVFHNENFDIGVPEEGWNGKLNGNRLNPGVYVFTLQVVDATGKTKYFTGDLTLVE